MSHVQDMNQNFRTRMKGTLGLGFVAIPSIWFLTVTDNLEADVPMWIRVLVGIATPVLLALWPVAMVVGLLALIVQAIVYPFQLAVAGIRDAVANANTSQEDENSNQNQNEPTSFGQLYEHTAFQNAMNNGPNTIKHAQAITELADIVNRRGFNVNLEMQNEYFPENYKPIFAEVSAQLRTTPHAAASLNAV
jgi:hypothetical protein